MSETTDKKLANTERVGVLNTWTEFKRKILCRTEIVRLGNDIGV